MSDMKCPICGNDLEQYHTGLVCYRHCLNGKNVWGSEETLKELIRTRKALEIAVDALNKYTDASGNWWYGYEFQGHYEDYAGEYADKALEQITALEQKDK